jgi:osmoprotectant transport system permease protein
VSEQLALLPGYLTAHLQLALFALLLGVLVSVPLGVLVARVGWLEPPVLGAVNVIQTIPSLALLAVMVPLLAALGVQSIGYLPAFIGLTLYSMLPIVRNTATGLASIDPALIEAARGVGMTDTQRLFAVELPLARPIIIAGIRTSAVWTVGIATLSTPVGATSLGNYIFSGLQTRNSSAVLLGCVAAAGLALALDGLIRLLSLGLEHGRRLLLGAAMAPLLLLYLYAAGSSLAGRHSQGNRIVVGAKTFTEQYILSELLAAQLGRVGLPATVAPSLGSTVAFDALRSGDIDVYGDYSGTIWATLMHKATAGTERARVLSEVESWLAREHGIAVACALGFENAYALAMRRTHANQLRVRRIGDLTALAGGLSIGGDYEFFARAEWRALTERYHLAFAKQRSMDSSLMYQAVAQGDVDVISAFSTEGRITALDLVILEDEQAAIPPYDALILVSKRLQKQHPQATVALRALAGRIDEDRMRRMNLEVDAEGKSPSSVAHAFLDTLGAPP